MQGPIATKHIRDLGYTGPIFGVTGNATVADKEHFLAHGASAVIIKPFKMVTFTKALEAYHQGGPTSSTGWK